METLPKEIISAILSFLIEDKARRAARVVCKEWHITINYADFNISRAVTLGNVDQLRDLLLKHTRPFSLNLTHSLPSDIAVSKLLSPLSHLTALYYRSSLPTLQHVTNLLHLSVFAAPADWLLQQSHLTSLVLAEVKGDKQLLVPNSLPSLQALKVDGSANPLLEAVTATKLTSLWISAGKPFDVARYSNLKHLFLRQRNLQMEINLPNLEELQIATVMRVSSTRLTSLIMRGTHGTLPDMLTNLTTLKSLTCNWQSHVEQSLSLFTTLRHLETLHVSTASKKVLQYLQPDCLQQLKLTSGALIDYPEDIAHLSRLTNLRSLETQFTVVAMDLTILAPLTKLEELTLTYTTSHNVEVVTTMTRLQSLSLTNTTSNVPVVLALQALSRLAKLNVISECLRLNNLSTLYKLEWIRATCKMDFNQVDGAHLTYLHVNHHDDTFWHSLTRMTSLLELRIGKLNSAEEIVALSVLTRLTCLYASDCTNEGGELTRLTSLRSLRYFTHSRSVAVEQDITKNLVHLIDFHYVFAG